MLNPVKSFRAWWKNETYGTVCNMMVGGCWSQHTEYFSEIAKKYDDFWTWRIEGRVPLHHAVCEKCGSFFEDCLAVTKDLNIKTSTGKTSLHLALLVNSEWKARALVEKGADPTVPDAEGVTPFAWMSDKGWHEVVQMCLSKLPDQFILAIAADLKHDKDVQEKAAAIKKKENERKASAAQDAAGAVHAGTSRAMTVKRIKLKGCAS